ncbi:ATP-binding protein [Dactylosporangium sp. CS-033363]|uniref:ATP-binding protein n=1 Tax=Dactylosporangium sp. CS-033363 TaxID=3239935 RepID=UPI003D8FC726
MERRPQLTAGVSTLLAIAAGVLTNVVTSGWTWPVGAGLVALAGAWIGFEIWRAGHGRDQLAGRVAQLPADTALFTGRRAELERVVSGGAAVVAIDGMAGIGKTALAVRAAHRLAGRFPDGCLFLDLHGYTEDVAPIQPAQALPRLLRAIGVPGEQIPAEADDQAALWRGRLAGRRVLVVLDNARTAEQVRPLLPAGPGCLALVTSRRRLLALDDARSVSLDGLPDGDSVALFGSVAGRERVRAHADAVDRIVAACGGLPLAVRIAAARLRARPMWTAEDLAGELAVERLDDGERSVPAALALSVADLDPAQRRLWCRLSLHPGTDADSAAAAALAGIAEPVAGPMLERLLDAHLLQQAVRGRFRFHDLVRAYAARLEHTEEPDEVRSAGVVRLLEHYTATVATADRTWLDAERANLVAATGVAAAHGRPELAVRLSELLLRYLREGGHYADALAIHAAGREAAHITSDRAGEAAALVSLGATQEVQGRFGEAAANLRRALDEYTDLGDLAGQSRALRYLGHVHWRRGPYDTAAGYAERALELARRLGDRTAEAAALDALGLVLERQDRDEEAAGLFDGALRLFRELGDPTGEAGVLDSLGCIASRQGRHRDAVDHHERSIAIHRAAGSRIGEAHARNDLGVAYRRHGDRAGAAQEHRWALAVFAAAGDKGGECEARNGLGEALRSAREHELALDLAMEIGDRFEEDRARAGLAALHRAPGR